MYSEGLLALPCVLMQYKPILAGGLWPQRHAWASTGLKACTRETSYNPPNITRELQRPRILNLSDFIHIDELPRQHGGTVFGISTHYTDTSLCVPMLLELGESQKFGRTSKTMGTIQKSQLGNVNVETTDAKSTKVNGSILVQYRHDSMPKNKIAVH